VTLDHKLGNWYHFIKPIHRITNLVTKCGILFYCYYLPWWVVQNAVLKKAFYRVRHASTVEDFMESRGAVARKTLGTTVLIK
jgi:hypothetical protein